MSCTVGRQSRVLRVAVGVVALGVGAYRRNWLGILGLFPLLSGITGWCPLPDPFGLSTCEAKDTSRYS